MNRIPLLIVVGILSAALLSAAEPPTPPQRYERIRNASHSHGAGGLAVLDVANNALPRDSNVGLEDLWATALKEGRTLFRTNRLWKATGPQQTGDMLGQTTIGPWQITIQNARDYGKRHGVLTDWTDAEVIAFLEKQPPLQARITVDFIAESYRDLGFRTPMAIQRYFWLDGFLQKKIGQGPWHASVLAQPAEMPQTGFYAKQLVLGSRFNPQGLLYWLYVSGDSDGIRQVLEAWSDAGYPISESDLSHCNCDAALQSHLRKTGLLK